MTVEALATRVNSQFLTANRPRPVTRLPRPAAPVDPMRVLIVSGDQLAGAGLVRLLDDCPDVAMVAAPAYAEVAIVMSERVTDATLLTLRSLATHGQLRTVLVVDHLDHTSAAGVFLASAVAVVRRSDLTRAGLRRLIRSVVAGQGVLPVDVLRAIVADASTTVPLRISVAGTLNDREAKVVRLLADGSDTREVAQRLCYSERTVKAVIQDITARYGLRNRSHMVAFALREGLI